MAGTSPAMTDDRHMSVSVETCPAMTRSVDFEGHSYAQRGREFTAVAAYHFASGRPLRDPETKFAENP
jgi:hypothetical protein